jgi:hypothetical protein
MSKRNAQQSRKHKMKAFAKSVAVVAGFAPIIAGVLGEVSMQSAAIWAFCSPLFIGAVCAAIDND